MLTRLTVFLLVSIPAVLQASSVTISSSSNPSVFGHPVTLTAAITPSTATGTVTFYDGTTVLETEPVANGTARFTTVLLQSGSQSLRAFYSGDTNNATCSSVVLAQTVNTIAGDGFLPEAIEIYFYNLSVAVGDFNGDGNPDLVAGGGYAFSGTTGLSVTLGNGDGTFQPQAIYALGNPYRIVAVGDFNGDGKPDLAATTDQSFTPAISVLFGNGDGTFQPPVNTLGSYNDSLIELADFNGDGKMDIAVNGASGGVLLGIGDGTFQPLLSSSALANSSSFAVGDFNGDGKPDLALATETGVSIALGNGDGTFQSPMNYGEMSFWLAVADFNGDGKLDLATDNSSGFQILLGNGDGTFQTGTNIAVNGAGYVVVGDFNGDGKADLAVCLDSGSYLVGVLLGNGDGTFQPQLNYNTSDGGGGITTPNSLVVADFNGDGAADLAINTENGEFAGVMIAIVTHSTTTSLTSSPNPSSLGENVQLSATVSPASATGTVTFLHGSTTLGTGILSAGSATFSTSTLAVGSHSLTANYGGDSDDAPSTSSAVTQTVGKSLTTTELTSSPNPSTFHQNITLTATVSPPTATGIVTFYKGTAELGSSDLSNGVATLIVSYLPAGSHILTASYGGDANDSISISDSLTQVVRSPTSTALTSSPNPSTVGQRVTLTATVSPSTANGTVTFSHGSTVLGTGVLTNGTAKLVTGALTAGLHSLTASFGGSTLFGPSISPIVTQVVK